jgi:hypothetical protein
VQHRQKRQQPELSRKDIRNGVRIAGSGTTQREVHWVSFHPSDL